MLQKKGIIVESLGDGRCRIFIPGVHSESMRVDPERRKYLPIAEPATPLMGIGGQNTPWGVGANMLPGTYVWIDFIDEDVNRPVYFAQTGNGPFMNFDKFNEGTFCDQVSSSTLQESCDDQSSSSQQPSSQWASEYYGIGMVSFKPTPQYEMLNMMGVANGMTRETSYGPLSRNSSDYQLNSFGQPADTYLSVDNGGTLRDAMLSADYLDKSIRPWSTTSELRYRGVKYVFSSKDEYKYVYATSTQNDYPSTNAPDATNSIKSNTELIFYLKDDGTIVSLSMPPSIQPSCDDQTSILANNNNPISGSCKPILSFGDNGVVTSSLDSIMFADYSWPYLGFDETRIAAMYGDADINILYLPDTQRWFDPMTNTDITEEICFTNDDESLLYCDPSYKVGKWFVKEITTTKSLSTNIEETTEKYYEIDPSSLFISRYNDQYQDAKCKGASDICIIPDDSVDNKYLLNQYGVLGKEEFITYDKTISYETLFSVDDSTKHYVTLVIEPVPFFDDDNPKIMTTPTLVDMGCKTKGVIDTYESFGKISGPSPTDCGLNNDYVRLSWDYSIVVEWTKRPTSIVDGSREQCTPAFEADDNGNSLVPTIKEVFYNDEKFIFSRHVARLDIDRDDFFYDSADHTKSINWGVYVKSIETGRWYDDSYLPIDNVLCDTAANNGDYSTKIKRVYDMSKTPGMPIELKFAVGNLPNPMSFNISFECNNILNPNGKARKIAAGYAPGVNLAMFLGNPVARFFENTSVSMLENNLWRYGMNIDFAAEPTKMTAQLKEFFNTLNGVVDQTSTVLINGKPHTISIPDKTRYRPYIPREISKSEVSRGTKFIGAREMVLHGDKVLVLDADMIVINGGRICFNAESIGILTNDYNVVSSSMPTWNNLDNSNTGTNLTSQDNV